MPRDIWILGLIVMLLMVIIALQVVGLQSVLPTNDRIGATAPAGIHIPSPAYAE